MHEERLTKFYCVEGLFHSLLVRYILRQIRYGFKHIGEVRDSDMECVMSESVHGNIFKEAFACAEAQMGLD